MGERSVRRWVVLTAVLVGTTGGLAPVSAAASPGPVVGPARTAPADPSADPAPAPAGAEPAPAAPPTSPAPSPADPRVDPPADPPVDPAPAPVGTDPAAEPAAPARSAVPAPTTDAAGAVPGPEAAATVATPSVGASRPAGSTLAAEPGAAEPELDAPFDGNEPDGNEPDAGDPDAGTGRDPDAGTSPACRAMTAEIHQANNPRAGTSLVSPFPGEVRKAGRFGFTEHLGVVFRASTRPAEGLDPVYRMYHPETGDFLWILTERGRQNAIERYGYRFEQVDFYASSESVPCAIPVHRYLKGDRHRLAASEADRRALVAKGWHDEGVKFWAAVPATTEPPAPEQPRPPAPEEPADRDDPVFTIAVLPDTQYEVFEGDGRFAQRNRWLVRNREALDLEFVLHTGDLVSWDTPDHDQYVRASAAMKVLDDARVPTTVTIGNHDTAAVAVGGSAVPGGNTKKLVRDTGTFNRYFSTGRYDPEGVFERGKIDNHYQLFSAGGEDWMILTLELWPRHGVVSWAREVVAAHPHHNVLVSTHSYLRSDGSIFPRHDYGATSPRYLYDKLVSQYPNIRMVFSGHVGNASNRVDVGVHGNKIASFMGTFHSLTTNPVQLVEIDTARDTVSTRFYAPNTGASWPRYAARVTGMNFS